MESVKRYGWLIIAFAILKFIIHLAPILFEGYGIFRDELYYLACAAHPATGYVDQPPLSIWLLGTFVSIFGDSWQVIRLVPALFGAATMAVLLIWVRSLRNDVFTICTAGIAFLFAPINLGFGAYYSMNSIDLFFWSLCFLTGLNVLRQPDKLLNWVFLGLVVGLGMLNKISISWFAIGFIAYILITPHRKLLLTKGPYIAGVLAFFLFLPFVIWNVQNDMAHLEFATNASRYKYAGISRADFLSGIFLLENPMSVVLMVSSVFFLFNRKFTLAERSAIIIFIVTLSILLIKGQVKSEYLAGAFLAVFAAGSVQLGSIPSKKLKTALVFIYLVPYVLLGIMITPMALPILPETTFINYSENLGLSPKNNEGKEEAALPQFYADMHGWENLAKNVSEAYQSLSDQEKKMAVAWVNNYGEAGAIDYYRKKYPLPPVLTGHNNYFLWGLSTLETRNFNVFIILDGTAEEHSRSLQDVRLFRIHTCEYCMPYENNLPVFIGRNPRQGLNLRDVFQQTKNFN